MSPLQHKPKPLIRLSVVIAVCRWCAYQPVATNGQVRREAPASHPVWSEAGCSAKSLR